MSQTSLPRDTPFPTRPARHAQRLRVLVDLTSADPARIRELAHAFSTVNSEDILQVRTLQANRDWTGLGVLAHRIKGAAQMTDDTQLSALCAALELLCADPAAAASALDDYTQRLEIALEEFGESFRRIAQDARNAEDA
ncbi:Hpt domain-containing protein [Achromobacter marplatensis]|jgi:HPt (histidine-containing phosphotransfer) domain-containing protein|uniref:Hpt domain-containing protein n=1 Tax=Achromobacter marplatensis TaxID=470868 RepID=UPI0028E66406|nr:Hpt domain-containing protein [Achromobacter marplatensis]